MRLLVMRVVLAAAIPSVAVWLAYALAADRWGHGRVLGALWVSLLAVVSVVAGPQS
jgi:hypothetical protein